MAVKKVRIPSGTYDIHDARISGVDSTVTAGSGNVVTSGAVATALTNYQPYEAFLQWGGKNFTGSYGCIDAAMVSNLGAPRTMYSKAAGIDVEYSRDGGTTWVDYGLTDNEKVMLFSTGGTFITGKNSSSGPPSTDNMLRVTLHPYTAGLYTTLNKFVIFVSTNGAGDCYCTIRARTQQNIEDNIDTWSTISSNVPITGWSGYNVINTVGFTTYGNSNSKAYQYGEIQFIFGYNNVTAQSYSGLVIYQIIGFGGVGWGTPSNMAKHGHLYNYDSAQNANFPAAVTATNGIVGDYIQKRGGTSSQFLKADGSVDSNTYATTASLGSYLPLAGGNMTGAGGIQYPISTARDCPNHYVSLGAGYSTDSGKDGLKVILNEYNGAMSGFGCDLTGGPYELTIAAGASQASEGKIVFAKHLRTSPKTYTTLGYFNPAGSLYVSNNIEATGDIRAKSNDAYIGSASGSQCHQQYDDTNKCLKFIFD